MRTGNVFVAKKFVCDSLLSCSPSPFPLSHMLQVQRIGEMMIIIILGHLLLYNFTCYRFVAILKKTIKTTFNSTSFYFAEIDLPFPISIKITFIVLKLTQSPYSSLSSLSNTPAASGASTWRSATQTQSIARLS